MNPTLVVWTLAQITNATKFPYYTPAITNNGLPFGDNQTLASPMAISGDVLGFGDFDGLTLVYCGLNEATGLWTTGTGWVADVSTASTYAATIPIASEQFATVVMTATYWTQFLADNPATDGAITLSALPSASDNPGQVLLAATVLPAAGRSVYCAAGFSAAPGGGYCRFDPVQSETLVAGAIMPDGQLSPRMNLTQADYNTKYTVNGVPVAPTDAAFITGLLFGTPYAPAPNSSNALVPPTPTEGSLWVLTVQGVSLNTDVPGGYICFMLYQDSNGDIFLLVGAAGPNGYLYTTGVQLYTADPLRTAELQLATVVNIFSDKLDFNVVSLSEVLSPSALDNFLQEFVLVSKTLLKVMFALLLA